MANVTIRDVKQVYWARVIAQCKRDKIEKGVTVSQWCVDHGIREKSYWYYHKKLGNQLAEELFEQEHMDTSVIPAVSFLPLEPPAAEAVVIKDSGVILRCGSVSVEVKDTISDSLLERLIKVMANV
ncbi:MAG: hypothetical protein IKI32_04705 [Lachnospiraceae bacterium]|nr:hypothetical protein [Lachnospiraceae bacterium]